MRVRPGGVQASRKGSALVLTLLIITTLTGLTIGFTDESRVAVTLAAFSRDSFIAYQAAKSHARFALDRLSADSDPEVDTLREEWAGFSSLSFPGPLPEGVSLSGTIVDESGKLNLNTLLNGEGEIDEQRLAQLIRLFQALGLSEGAADPIADWLDRDDIERLQGAESYYYQSLQEPYSCANGPFMTMGQIALVKGMENLERPMEGAPGRNLRTYLTTYSDGKININTAPEEVLQCLSDKMDPDVAAAITAYRRDQVFKVPEDLKKVPGMKDEIFSGVSDQITVRSSAFSIEVSGAFGDVVSGVRAVASREMDRIRLVSWQVR